VIQNRPLRHRTTFPGLTVAFVVLLAPTLPAAPVRVVTWDLQPKDPAAMNTAPQALPDAIATEATRVFKQLNPDVIVLQDVPDSAACDALIQSLRPEEYQLAVLSAFRDGQTGAVTRQQTAILSRTPVSRPRWDDWRSRNSSAAAPGGFASAIVRLENRDVAVFAVQLSDGSNNAAWESPAQQAAREDAARQLVEQIDALGDAANGGPAVVVAGDFNTTVEDAKLSRELTLTRLERAGLSNAFGDLPAERRITFPGNGQRPDATVDYIFTRDAGRTTVVQVVPAATTLHLPVAGNLNLGSADVAAAGGGTSTASAAPATEAADQSSFGRKLVQEVGAGNLWALAGLLAGGIACVGLGMILLARRGASNRAGNRPGNGGLSLSSPPNSGEILIMTRSTQTGSAAQTGPAPEAAPVVHVQAQSWPPAGTDAAEWQRRAEQAERRAERATGALRAGLLPQLAQWLKGAFTRQLISDREQLIEAQRQAALKMQVVDDRLTKVEQQIQRRMREYETRITDLEKELIAAREENRELIRAKIAQVRAEMERERARLLQHAQTGSEN
jgi:endonuclease/exonuclease/phosphatase family metal-dependent hydrolase